MQPSRAVATTVLLILGGLSAAGVRSYEVQAAEPSLMGALAPTIEARLPEWIAAWKAASPAFDLRRFRLTHFKALQESWSADAYDPGATYEELRKKLYITSPDGMKAINPYATLHFTARDGRTVAGFADDTGVMLIDITARRTMWLGLCDYRCGFHDAAWLANDRAVVTGYTIDFDDPNCPGARLCKAIPDLMVYDFGRRTVMLFQGPGTPAGPRQEYAGRKIQDALPLVSFN